MTLLLGLSGGVWAVDYYTPTADEVIILNNVYESTATTSGYSNHSAISWGGAATTATKTVGNPADNGATTLSDVTCHDIKGNGKGKNITLLVNGISKLTIYHEKHSSRYPTLKITPAGGSEYNSDNGNTNVYYNEFELDGTKSYTILLQGNQGSNDFYVYAVKLTKYVARTIDTQTLSGVKVGATSLTENALTAGYSVSGSTITLTDVAYTAPSNITLTNHVAYTDETSEDKNVAVTFDGTVTDNYWIGTATIGETDYTVKVPYDVQAVTAITVNGSAIGAEDLATLTSTKSVTIDGSSLNGIGMIGVILNGGSTTVSRSNSGNNVVYTFTINKSDNYTVTISNVKKTYSAMGDIVYYSKNGTEASGTNSKSLTANGIKFDYSSKSFQYGTSSVTIGSDVYVPIKLSTGEPTTVTFPDYKVATKVKVYGWSQNGDGKMYCIQETSDASGKAVGDLSSDIYYATNNSYDIYPSVYEYDLDNWQSMYFNAGGSPSQPFVIMDFVLADTRTALTTFAFSGGNTSVYTESIASFVAPTLTAMVDDDDITSDLTIGYTSSNTDVATVNASTGTVTLSGKAGTAKITATFAGNSTYANASAEYTITATVNPVGNHTITYTLDVASSEDKNKTDINSTNSSTSSYLNTLVGITNNTGGSYSKGSKANLTVKIPTDASYNEDHYMSVGFSVEDGYLFIPNSISVQAQPVTTNKNVKLVLTDGVNTIEKTQENLTQGSIATVTAENSKNVSFTGNVTLKVYCYGATDTYRLGSPITIEGVVVDASTAVPMAITSAGYASFSSTSEVAIPEGVTAYYVSAANNSYVTLTAIEGGYIPANTGAILEGAEGNYYATITSTGASLGATNLLHVWTSAGTPSEATYYTLAAGPTFKQSTGGTLAAGKAYLVIPDGARELKVRFGENATGIRSVDNALQTTDNTLYNLQGQKIVNSSSLKGLYIVNGKKVIIK